MGLEADPCWLKWWCTFPAVERAEHHTHTDGETQSERERETERGGGQSGEKQPLQESYRRAKTLPRPPVNHCFSSSANPGETESSEAERQKSWERRVCSQEVKHPGNNDIHPQRPKISSDSRTPSLRLASADNTRLFERRKKKKKCCGGRKWEKTDSG